MKTQTIIVLIAGLLPQLALAQATGVGGGDLCKNEIDKHRTEILKWIESDQANELDFSKAQIQGWNYSGTSGARSYKQEMIKVLQPGKVVVTCYLDPRSKSEVSNIERRSIQIANTTTSCINYEDQLGISHIDCDYDKIMNEKAIGNPNYVLTHHEFASIAGVEQRTNSSTSDFSISNQLSEFEQWVHIKVLGKKKQVTSAIPSSGPGCTLSLTGAKEDFKRLKGKTIRGYTIVKKNAAFDLDVGIYTYRAFTDYTTYLEKNGAIIRTIEGSDDYDYKKKHPFHCTRGLSRMMEKNYAIKGILSHSSGFKRSTEYLCDRGYTEERTDIHPFNQEILSQMQKAATATQYEYYKNQYRSDLDVFTPAKNISHTEQILNQLPTCQEALGK